MGKKKTTKIQKATNKQTNKQTNKYVNIEEPDLPRQYLYLPMYVGTYLYADKRRLIYIFIMLPTFLLRRF
jgi:hypothetical protein